MANPISISDPRVAAQLVQASQRQKQTDDAVRNAKNQPPSENVQANKSNAQAAQLLKVASDSPKNQPPENQQQAYNTKLDVRA